LGRGSEVMAAPAPAPPDVPAPSSPADVPAPTPHTTPAVSAKLFIEPQVRKDACRGPEGHTRGGLG